VPKTEHNFMWFIIKEILPKPYIQLSDHSFTPEILYHNQIASLKVDFWYFP